MSIFLDHINKFFEYYSQMQIKLLVFHKFLFSTVSSFKLLKNLFLNIRNQIQAVPAHFYHLRLE